MKNILNVYNSALESNNNALKGKNMTGSTSANCLNLLSNLISDSELKELTLKTLSMLDWREKEEFLHFHQSFNDSEKSKNEYKNKKWHTPNLLRSSYNYNSSLSILSQLSDSELKVLSSKIVKILLENCFEDFQRIFEDLGKCLMEEEERGEIVDEVLEEWLKRRGEVERSSILGEKTLKYLSAQLN